MRVDVQMIFLDKIPEVGRAHICFLIAQGVIYIEAVDSELVWHHDNTVVVYFSCNPMMAADRLEPPYLVTVRKSDAVLLVSAIFLMKHAKALYTLAGTFYVRKRDHNKVFLADSTSLFLICSLFLDYAVSSKKQVL